MRGWGPTIGRLWTALVVFAACGLFLAYVVGAFLRLLREGPGSVYSGVNKYGAIVHIPTALVCGLGFVAAGVLGRYGILLLRRRE